MKQKIMSFSLQLKVLNLPATPDFKNSCITASQNIKWNVEINMIIV